MKQHMLAFIFLVSINGILFSQQKDDLYFSKVVDKDFEETTLLVKEAFKKQGFGVITEIEMHDKLKEKLPDIKVEPYRILGVCNPSFAWQTLQEEENIGIFLPCKVVIKHKGKSRTEVVVVNPSAMMQILGNDKLTEVATMVTIKFEAALEEL